MARKTHPMVASLRAADTGKIVSAREAVRLIRSGDTVATGGFVGIGFAEASRSRSNNASSRRRAPLAARAT